MTPDKKDIPKKSTKQPKPAKESKEEYFLRIAKPRVLKVLDAFRILGNCSNRNNYAYTVEQTSKMFDKITKAYNTLISKFTESKQESESFEF